jgi:phytoene synthase
MGAAEDGVSDANDPIAASHAVMSRHARSFRLAARFLPAEARDDAALLYAFCREVDDAADECADPEEGATRLAALERGLAGEPGGAAAAAHVRALARRRQVPLSAAYDLIEGARTDLGRVRMADDAALLRYAYLVAGTVGSMMCSLLGARHERARRRAIDLGIAMQITNVCRDVAEDAARGRVYLPATRLEAAGSSAGALLDGTAPRDAVAEVVRDLLALADRYYASADVGAADLPPRARLAVLTASRVYRAIGVELRERGCDPLGGRVVVPPLRKARWTGAALASWVRVSLGFRRPVESPADEATT